MDDDSGVWEPAPEIEVLSLVLLLLFLVVVQGC